MIKRALLVLAGTLLFGLFGAPTVHADVNDFVITTFAADYSLSKADPQGELRVRETIGVDFSDNNHGILRAIPNTYKKHRLQLSVTEVTSSSGAPVQYTTYQSSGNTVLKIGDPDKTVTGPQEYTIAYTVRNVIGFYDDHAELYWDINGDQWAQRAEHVTLTLHLPEGLKTDRTPICFTGTFGSTRQQCTTETKGSELLFATTQPLQPYETLTIVAGFEPGFFEPSKWYETAGEYRNTVFKFLIPLLLIGGLAGRHWHKYGRDPKGRGVIVPHYEAPDNLTPIEAGTVADFRTDNRDITATVIDLAIRGYLKIIETTQVRKFRKDITTYSLRLVNADFSGLNEFETKLLKGVFEKQLQTGAEVELSELKYKLVATATALRKDVRDSLVTRDYFRKTPFSVSVRFGLRLGLAFVVGLIFAIMFEGAAVLGLIVGSVIAVIFICLLASRTPKGVAAKEAILGLKQYLEVAEAQRLKKLQGPNAAYAETSSQPKKTVHLFEKLLPYAMVLGVEEQWAKQFEHIYKTPPDWYQGNWTAFNAVYLTTALNSGVQSGVNTAFSSPSSSSSSGFSGGSSGGGGGGGGGGGW